MNKLILIFVLTLSSLSFAQSGRPTAVGIFLGNPTSLVGKHWISNKAAVQGGLAFDLSDYVLIYGDYLLHYPSAIRTSEPFLNSLIPYIGVGGVFVVTTDDRRKKDRYLDKDSGSVGLGFRLPLGLEWKGTDPSIGVYVEVSPGISVIPETSALFMGGVGARFYF